MDTSSPCPVFSSLPTRHPWSAWAVSYGAQSSLLLLFLMGTIIVPHSVLLMERHFTPLVAVPPLVNHTPQPLRPKLMPVPRPVPEPLQPAKLNAPSEVPPAPPNPAPIRRTSQPLAPAVPVAPPVRTGVFSTGSSAVPTVPLTPREVQTGGFGDPNGVPSSQTGNARPNIAQLGSFDLPAGSGYGNGTGGTQGARGVVVSAGFGNGIAKGGEGPGAGGRLGTVRPGGFASQQPPSSSTPRSAAPRAVAHPMEIISKPKPAYTDEARKRGVEGEVLLEVVFEASGQVRVVRVVRGLGYGLDEAAVNAANQIRFRPAQRDGSPVDTTAVLHIVFEIT